MDGAALVPFVRVLYNLPTLTALGISSPPGGVLGPRIFDVLCSPASSNQDDASSSAGPSASSYAAESWVLPKLEALCLQNCRDVSGHEILRVVLARNGAALNLSGRRGEAEGVSAIKFVKVSQCYGLDPDVHELLAREVGTLRVIC